jgi:thiamine biosynthesis lipoprotein
MASFERRADYFVGHFNAMASPCEILIDTKNENIAKQAIEIAHLEAERIEKKFSRYREDNIIYQINSGNLITVDDETARLLDYADKLFQISEERFDITAGVLRRVWKFDGSDRIPKQAEVDKLLPFIGWSKIQWNNPVIQLPNKMEIDLGGIGKEYAVDRTALLVQSFLNKQQQENSVLINFGGDISALGPKIKKGRAWAIGVDTGIDDSNKRQNTALLTLIKGGVATSGDTRRYLQKDGKRYGHILDPRTGWPVENAPTLVTVAASTCTDAGMLSTLAMLHGKDAEEFLRMQDVKYWVRR